MKIIFIILGLFSVSSAAYNVMDFKAKGDGVSDDSKAFLEAWKQVCSDRGSKGVPTMTIPSRNFFLDPIKFEGPCASNRIILQMQGTIVAPSNPTVYGKNPDAWIGFTGVRGLSIEGSGTFDGKGSSWWSYCRAHDFCSHNGPTALHFEKCDGLKVSGTKHMNSQRNHISISDSNNVEVSGLHVAAPQDSPNTDGFDISGSSNVFIHDTTIATGDDCIAINERSKFINISRVNCGPGHGISIGSLKDRDTVEEVHVSDCNFTKTDNGVRIKTWTGWSGFVRGVSFVGISMHASDNPIIIDQHYTSLSNEQRTGSQIADITYSKVVGTSSVSQAITLNCVRCVGIVMDHVTITPASAHDNVFAKCSNAQGREIASSPDVPCLSK